MPAPTPLCFVWLDLEMTGLDPDESAIIEIGVILTGPDLVPVAEVERVIRMVDRAEYKRRQAPPGIRITPRAFGRDRRLPITNRFGQ